MKNYEDYVDAAEEALRQAEGEFSSGFPKRADLSMRKAEVLARLAAVAARVQVHG